MSKNINQVKLPKTYTLKELKRKSVKQLRNLAKTDKIKLSGAKRKDEILKIISAYYFKATKSYLNMPDTPEIPKMKEMYTRKELEFKTVKQLKNLAKTNKIKLSGDRTKEEIIRTIYEKVKKTYDREELESRTVSELSNLAKAYKIKLSKARKKDEIIRIIYEKINITYN